MDPKITQLLQQIVRLADHIKREAEETEMYVRKNNKYDAQRNLNASSDEVQDLMRKWQEVSRLVQSQKG